MGTFVCREQKGHLERRERSRRSQIMLKVQLEPHSNTPPCRQIFDFHPFHFTFSWCKYIYILWSRDPEHVSQQHLRARYVRDLANATASEKRSHGSNTCIHLIIRWIAGRLIFYLIFVVIVKCNTDPSNYMTLPSSSNIISLNEVHDNVAETLSIDQPTRDSAEIVITTRDGSTLSASFATRVVLENHSVKNFGAKGDGSTDDTAAIQDAINDRDLVYVPPGVYLVRSEISLKSGTIIFGDGYQRSVFKKGPHSSHYDPWFMFNAVDIKGIEMKDVGFDGNSSVIDEGGFLRHENASAIGSGGGGSLRDVTALRRCRFVSWNASRTPEAIRVQHAENIVIDSCLFSVNDNNAAVARFVECANVNVRQVELTGTAGSFCSCEECESATLESCEVHTAGVFVHVFQNNGDVAIMANRAVVNETFFESNVSASSAFRKLRLANNSVSFSAGMQHGRSLVELGNASQAAPSSAPIHGDVVMVSNLLDGGERKATREYSLVSVRDCASLSCGENVMRIGKVEDDAGVTQKYIVAFVHVRSPHPAIFVVLGNVFRGSLSSSAASSYGAFSGVRYEGASSPGALAFLNSGTGTPEYSSYVSVGSEVRITNR